MIAGAHVNQLLNQEVDSAVAQQKAAAEQAQAWQVSYGSTSTVCTAGAAPWAGIMLLGPHSSPLSVMLICGSAAMAIQVKPAAADPPPTGVLFLSLSVAASCSRCLGCAADACVGIGLTKQLGSQHKRDPAEADGLLQQRQCI
jgi:hypothetical protein